MKELPILAAEKRAPRFVPKKPRTVHKKEARSRSTNVRAKVKATKPSTNASRASRALELAVQALEIIVDASAPAEKLAKRKQWLTEGPAEFRECRLDLPKDHT